MAKYRIVKRKHADNLYMIQQKIFGLFWYTRYGDIFPYSLNECILLVEDYIAREKLKKDNPRDIVVKTY